MTTSFHITQSSIVHFSHFTKKNYFHDLFLKHTDKKLRCMAGKVAGIIKLELDAGKASPAPPVGPALGAKGVNIMAFCKEYNARTAESVGTVIPVELKVFEDKSFSIKLKTPPASVLIKKAASIEKGSANPKKQLVGNVTNAKIEEIALIKLIDLNCTDIKSAMRTVFGTCVSMVISQLQSQLFLFICTRVVQM